MIKLTNIIISALFLLLTSFEGKADLTCTKEIPANEFIIDGSDIAPGEVICLLGGNKGYILMRNIQGTASEPITVINKGGAVVINTDHNYGVKFDNCKHVIFLGNGENNLGYGIQVKRVGNGAGMSVDNRSTNIEIAHVEVAYTAIAGIYAKTEPYQGDCDNLVTRDNFTMYDLKIHDCFLHDIADEGFYIGSSKYTGQTVYECNDVEVLPHLIEGVEVYNNIVENTGWDGIQVSSAPIDCKIYNNIIRNDSYAEELYQMSGILIGGGAKCDCYNNEIWDGKGDGIDVFGMGFMKIYNNLVVRPGKTFEPGNPNSHKSGIYIGSVTGALSPNATFKLYNNTIVSPKSFGITYNNSDATMGYISNNLITDPGYGSSGFINLMVADDKVTQQNNYLSISNSEVKFINYSGNNFDIKPDSPAINYGTSLTNEGITFDILNRARPFHTYFDAGAYESHDPTADVIDIKDQPQIIYPNPANDFINIDISNINAEHFTLQIISLDGKVLFNQKVDKNEFADKLVKLNITNLKPGKYILILASKDKVVSNPLIVSE